MKKQLYVVSYAFLITGILFLACSKGGASAGGAKKGLNPDSLDPDKPLSVKQLSAAYFAWKGRTVTLSGYCKFFFDKGKIGKKVELVANPGDRKGLVSCSMRQEYPEGFSRDQPVVISGQIKRDGYWGIELEDCILVSRGKTVKTVPPNPYDSDKAAVYKLADFVRSYRGWKGKELSVKGYYRGTTTSTTSYGKTIRIDLQCPNNRKLVVGCQMREPHERIDRRSGVIIRGMVSGEVFGNVRMTNCILVNR